MTKLTGSDCGWLAALSALGAFVWLRDASALKAASDTLPILAALPLFVWLGAPWRFVPATEKISLARISIGGVFLAAGVLGDLTVALALGWTLLLWAWLRSRIAPEQHAVARRLLVLPLLAFPWIIHEGQPLAWWFRLSASASAQALFSATGLSVTREGTNLLVQGTPIAVAPACAGLDTLQAMLIAGCAPAFFCFGERGGAKYWLSLPALLAMSWLANTARVIVICVAAVSFGSEFAMGKFHDIGGWLVLLMMFGLCCGAFSLVRQLFEKNSATHAGAAAR